MRRSGGLSAVLLAAVVVLTGCSPPDVGALGILRQNDGTLSVLVRLCEGSIHKVGLDAVGQVIRDESGQSDKSYREIGTIWQEIDPPVSESGEIPFSFVEADLRADTRYRLWGVVAKRDSDDLRQIGNAYSAMFKADELAELERGFVLTDLGTESGVLSHPLSPSDFDELAVEYCE